MVFQNYALYPNMTVRDNIGFPLKMKGMKKEEIEKRVKRVPKLSGITDILKMNVTKISGGSRESPSLGQ